MSKNSIILPNFVELSLRVYNGKTFTILKIIDEMVGHKLGEFVSTRKQFSYKKKKINNNGSKDRRTNFSARHPQEKLRIKTH